MAIFTDSPRVARPIWLVHVPLLGPAADVVLEDACHVLGDPRYVLAKRAPAGGVHRWVYDGSVPVPTWTRVDADQDEWSASADCEGRGAAGQRRAFAEELHFDAVAHEVAVAHQAGHLVVLDRTNEGCGRPFAERHRGQAHGGAFRDEPFEQLLRLEHLHDGRHRHALEGQPIATPLPTPDVWQRHHHALAVRERLAQVLTSGFEPPVQPDAGLGFVGQAGT